MVGSPEREELACRRLAGLGGTSPTRRHLMAPLRHQWSLRFKGLHCLHPRISYDYDASLLLTLELLYSITFNTLYEL